jgi:glycosyltransferase involved in cell wall biosynthesis
MYNSDEYHVSHLIGNAGLYGAERWILAFFRAANGCGIRFSLVNFTEYRRNPSDIVRAVSNLNILAHDFFTGGRFNPMAGIRFGLWAQKNKVKILHCHGFKADTIGLIASLVTRCKVITTPHGWGLEKDLKLKIYEKFDRILFYFMDKIVPLSPQIYFDLIRKKQLANKTRLIENAIDIIEIDSTNKPCQRDYNIFLIGYIGRLVEGKNLFFLLEAVKLLSIKRDRFKLLIVGDGVLRPSLEAEVIRLGIASYVQFYGFKKNALNILKSMNLLILPSLAEGIPRCVMEAMVARIPVIASDIPGNRVLINHGETGLLFDPHNIKDLLKNIIFIMDGRQDTNLMVSKAREKIEKKYSNFRMANEYLELYNSLLYKN